MSEPNEYLHSIETHFYGDGCDEAHGSWVNMEQAIAEWRALADDLADDLCRNGIDSPALARYREASQPEAPRDYSPEDYLSRCSDVATAIKATTERIDEWDEAVDPHGWWHERPGLIALVTEIAMLRGELARYREASQR